MPSNLDTQIKGTAIAGPQLLDALVRLPSGGFSKAEFASALVAVGLPEANDGDLVRRVMQFLKRKGLIDYHEDAASWSLTPLGQMRLPTPTLPLLENPEPVMSEPTTPPPSGFWDRLSGGFRVSLSHLACLAIIAALVAINASFAWELGEDPILRWAFVAGLMASDLLRPLLIARGLWDFDQWRLGRGTLAFLITFALAPVSILSSTTVISASLFLGEEQNQQAEAQNDTRQLLITRQVRLQAEVDQLWLDWETECQRGGCGHLADKIEAEAKVAEQAAKEQLAQIISLTEAGNQPSDFIARAVKTFAKLRLFGEGRNLLIPLLLALTLEIAALFGPALLLGRR
ncbi:MAG: hypothetical protein COC12_01815 [Rhodobacteraceae bacterium]|nr:MAG: hypothetical protein COC12_01815 [Paracoccaceae bacterium]